MKKLILIVALSVLSAATSTAHATVDSTNIIEVCAEKFQQDISIFTKTYMTKQAAFNFREGNELLGCQKLTKQKLVVTTTPVSKQCANTTSEFTYYKDVAASIKVGYGERSPEYRDVYNKVMAASKRMIRACK